MRTVALTKESTKDILENLLKRSPNNYGKFEAAVDEILNKVKTEGDAALFAYTKEFDKTEISADTIKVTEEEIKEYQHKVKEIVENSDGLSTPQVAEKMDNLRQELFGNVMDYTEIKQYYNQLMLDHFPYMKNKVDTSENHLKTAIQYAMVGNYIDFGALENVNEDELKAQLDEAININIDSKLLDVFKNDLVNAKRLVYFTDNCGEIVTDKLLISTLRDINPNLHITVIVRGKPVLNDATLEDAKYIHMEDVAQKVIGNGTRLPGNVIGAISKESMDEVENADLLISKGQGNYEGLSRCGLNIYYLFLCKCEMFMRRFGVEQFTGIMTREEVIK